MFPQKLLAPCITSSLCEGGKLLDCHVKSIYNIFLPVGKLLSFKIITFKITFIITNSILTLYYLYVNSMLEN